MDSFERNLFVNCPFDPEYFPLLQCLIFTVLECGLQPRLALEEADSGQVRVYNIELVKDWQTRRPEPRRP